MYQLCKLEDGLPLWMDTLCIPWEVAKRRARTKAIANINNIYLDATKVVVIADDLLALEYMRDCASGRIWLQFQMSSWMKRFWTLQEGAFAGERLFVRFKDELVNCSKFINVRLPFRNFSPVSEFITGPTQVFRDIRNYAKRGKTGRLISRILHELKWRDTAWESDQPVVFAGLLGLNPTPLLEVIRQKDKPNSECTAGRMQRLFERIDEFPTMILYSSVERFLVPGLRWAPKTLKIPDWNDDLPHAGWPAGFLSGAMGKVRPTGLELSAHLILVEVRKLSKHIPRILNVLLEPSKAPDRRAQGIDGKSITFAIEQLEWRHSREGNNHEDDERIGESNARSRCPRKEFNLAQDASANGSHLAIVLKGFDRAMASKDGFRTEGAIVDISDGIKYYKKYSNQHQMSNFMQLWFDFGFQYQPLSGRYVCPVTVIEKRHMENFSRF